MVAPPRGADAWACLRARVHWMTRGLRHWAVEHCTCRHVLSHIAGKLGSHAAWHTDCDSVQCGKRGLSNSLMAHTIASSTCGPVNPGINLTQTRKSPAPGRRPGTPIPFADESGNVETFPGHVSRPFQVPDSGETGNPRFPGKPGESGSSFLSDEHQLQWTRK